MASEEVAGIGALIKPNKYSILKFVELHPGGAAALSGQVLSVPMALLSSLFLPTLTCQLLSSLLFLVTGVTFNNTGGLIGSEIVMFLDDSRACPLGCNASGWGDCMV